MKRFPLRQRAVLIGLAGVAVQVLTGLGIDSHAFIVLANGAIAALTILGLVTSVEPLVTPVDDPRATDGQPLIRADQAEQLVEWKQAVDLELSATPPAEPVRRASRAAAKASRPPAKRRRSSS